MEVNTLYLIHAFLVKLLFAKADTTIWINLHMQFPACMQDPALLSTNRIVCPTLRSGSVSFYLFLLFLFFLIACSIFFFAASWYSESNITTFTASISLASFQQNFIINQRKASIGKAYRDVPVSYSVFVGPMARIKCLFGWSSGRPSRHKSSWFSSAFKQILRWFPIPNFMLLLQQRLS
jgi:hypothetical protein